jgi:ADP-dependent NAD(P)H-hydrate dehydratase / NAD(P)H-hydrate epimerase
MKLFFTKQIAEIDRYTIEHEPISDIDLMERAALQIVNWLLHHISNEKKLMVFAGPGNNGGDALAIARMMAGFDYNTNVYLLDFGKELSGSPLVNLHRIEEQNKVSVSKIGFEKEIPEISINDVVIDGLFGSGLSRPLEGLVAVVVRKINKSGATIVSIDIPSGLMGEDNHSNIPGNIIRANFTLTFQFPKISFFFPENEKYVGEWQALPIGLHPEGIRVTKSEYHFLAKEDITKIVPTRSRFGHKGIFGHALLIAGSYGKLGAAILSSRACLRSGVGLLTTHIPKIGYDIIQTSVPEAMVSTDISDMEFTGISSLEDFSAIGIGPGIGKKENTQQALFHLLKKSDKPMVIDADAINILSENKEWLDAIPENSVVTPHPGEFKRLVGDFNDSFQRLTQQLEFSKNNKLILVFKGAFTTITTPDGIVYFNSTGNPGMATAGSGDVLTGIILGLLAQGLKPEEAALAGVYLHGLAGDIAKMVRSEEALIASDIIESLGQAFLGIKTQGE